MSAALEMVRVAPLVPPVNVPVNVPLPVRSVKTVLVEVED
jgi:hypothetical protein